MKIFRTIPTALRSSIYFCLNFRSIFFAKKWKSLPGSRPQIKLAVIFYTLSVKSSFDKSVSVGGQSTLTFWHFSFWLPQACWGILADILYSIFIPIKQSTTYHQNWKKPPLTTKQAALLILANYDWSTSFKNMHSVWHNLSLFMEIEFKRKTRLHQFGF